MGTVLATLGEGRFGKVTCVKRNSDGRMVAVKQYDRKKATETGRVARILEEKAVMQLLNCPYVTRFLETAKDDTSLYIVMEAALGGPLHRHIQLHGNLPVSHAQIYLAQLVSCCEHMAKHGCIHRDIKASNCVLNEKGHIKLCDFGCSKVLYSSSDHASMLSSEPTSGPRTFTFLGSHHIMPIEMLQGSGYGVSVDWWALGVLLFEMIAGSPPFDNKPYFVPENPSSNLCDYNWDVNFEDISPFSSLRDKDRTAYTSADKLLESARELISDFLNFEITRRVGIWNIQNIKNSTFLREIDFSFIDQGVCSPLSFDERVGYLELLNHGDDTKDRISENDQKLFDGF